MRTWTVPSKYTDNVAEWLRRWIANPLLFEREGSNPSDVGFSFLLSKLMTFYIAHQNYSTSTSFCYIFFWFFIWVTIIFNFESWFYSCFYSSPASAPVDRTFPSKNHYVDLLGWNERPPGDWRNSTVHTTLNATPTQLVFRRDAFFQSRLKPTGIILPAKRKQRLILDRDWEPKDIMDLCDEITGKDKDKEADDDSDDDTEYKED